MYAGTDPISNKRIHPTDVVPAGPEAGQEAERVPTRLLDQVDERRSPRTRPLVSQGRYHNDKYRALAAEVGLELTQHQQFGWTLHDALPEPTAKQYRAD